MSSETDLSNFRIGWAVLSFSSGEAEAPPSFYIEECNSFFTTLSTLSPGPEEIFPDQVFGKTALGVFRRICDLSPGTFLSLKLKFKTTGVWIQVQCQGLAEGGVELLCMDITTDQNELQSFRFQEHGYKMFIENLQCMAFQRILQGSRRMVFTAGAFPEITGYPLEQAKTFERWIEIVHPEDRDRVRAEGDLLYTQPGYKRELEYRIIRKDGTIRWIHSYDSNFASEDGTMQMAQGLIVDVTERKIQELALEEAYRKIQEQNILLKEQSLSDPLTGLENRRAAMQILEYLFRIYKRSGELFCVILVDLDFFKKVNDNYGHDAGDQVLCEISRVFRARLRQIDTIARWGGEEFLVILPKTDREAGLLVAEDLLEAVREMAVLYHTYRIKVTFSGGLGEVSQFASIQQLLIDVDKALYNAKGNGRNRVTPA